jgi:hypothetical protein
MCVRALYGELHHTAVESIAGERPPRPGPSAPPAGNKDDMERYMCEDSQPGRLFQGPHVSTPTSSMETHVPTPYRREVMAPTSIYRDPNAPAMYLSREPTFQTSQQRAPQYSQGGSTYERRSHIANTSRCVPSPLPVQYMEEVDEAGISRGHISDVTLCNGVIRSRCTKLL